MRPIVGGRGLKVVELINKIHSMMMRKTNNTTSQFS